MKTTMLMMLTVAALALAGNVAAQGTAPAAPAAEAAKVDYKGKIKVLMCMFKRGTFEWQVQLKNTTKEPITLDTLGISIRDYRNLEIGRGGARNVILKPGIVVFLKGFVDTRGNVDWSKAIKAEPIFNPENPDTYIK